MLAGCVYRLVGRKLTAKNTTKTRTAGFKTQSRRIRHALRKLCRPRGVLWLTVVCGAAEALAV